MAYGEAIKAAGGSADWINLPDIGIKGNSHMVMQDKNSDQVAEVIQKWLTSKGIVGLRACPARDAARRGASQMRDPGCFTSVTGVPGLQRIIACCAAPGTRADYKSNQ